MAKSKKKATSKKATSKKSTKKAVKPSKKTSKAPKKTKASKTAKASKESKKAAEKTADVAPFVYMITGEGHDSIFINAIWAPKAEDACKLLLGAIPKAKDAKRVRGVKPLTEFSAQGKLLKADKKFIDICVSVLPAEPIDGSLVQRDVPSKNWLCYIFSDNTALEIPLFLRGDDVKEIASVVLDLTNNKSFPKSKLTKSVVKKKGEPKRTIYTQRVSSKTWKKFIPGAEGEVTLHLEELQFINPKHEPEGWNMKHFVFDSALKAYQAGLEKEKKAKAKKKKAGKKLGKKSGKTGKKGTKKSSGKKTSKGKKTTSKKTAGNKKASKGKKSSKK